MTEAERMIEAAAEAVEQIGDEELELFLQCPCCGGPGQFLGALGSLTWFRCRNCGIDFKREGGS
jgi:uncharacterized C2H2 Zn-finger protein